MAYKLEITDNGYSVEIASELRIPLESHLLQDFGEALTIFYNTLTVALLEVMKTSDGPPVLYNYRFETSSGREWNQTLSFVNINHENPGQTFAVPGPFTLSEFEPHRAVRNSIIRLINHYHVETIEVSW